MLGYSFNNLGFCFCSTLHYNAAVAEVEEALSFFFSDFLVDNNNFLRPSLLELRISFADKPEAASSLGKMIVGYFLRGARMNAYYRERFVMMISGWTGGRGRKEHNIEEERRLW